MDKDTLRQSFEHWVQHELFKISDYDTARLDVLRRSNWEPDRYANIEIQNMWMAYQGGYARRVIEV